MKKVLLVVVLVGAVFVVYNRQRLFLRDPLGSVERDGVKESGAQVYINYSNDVLIENDNAPMYVKIVQHGNHVGVPQQLKCLHWVACLMDADAATLIAADPEAVVESMTGRGVQFREGKQKISVKLR